MPSHWMKLTLKIAEKLINISKKYFKIVIKININQSIHQATLAIMNDDSGEKDY